MNSVFYVIELGVNLITIRSRPQKLHVFEPSSRIRVYRKNSYLKNVTCD